MNVLKTDLLSNIEFIKHGFFDRNGGVSKGTLASLNSGFEKGDLDENVINNRKKIASYFDVELSNLIILNQIHGDNVHFINSENAEKYKFSTVEKSRKHEGDAIITNQKGLLIGVNTADCAPILISDSVEKVIAVIHVGWKGAIGRVIENTFSKLKELNCKNLIASVGPCLKKKSFVIQADTAIQIESRYFTSFKHEILFDMSHLILEKLMSLGAKKVSQMSIDTFVDENFYSYRRQHGKNGVQFSGIVIQE